MTPNLSTCTGMVASHSCVAGFVLCVALLAFGAGLLATLVWARAGKVRVPTHEDHELGVGA
jgi:hypothetical protein